MEIKNIPLNRIVTHERNLRREVGDVTELAASIAATGLLQPIVVSPVRDELSDEDCYVLIAGHRRVSAAVKVPDVHELPAVVRTDLDSDSKVIEAMLIENLQRSDLTPMEEARGYEQLTLDGYDVARIAKATGRAEGTVRHRLTLTKLPDEVQERVHERQLSLADAEAMAEFADEPAVIEELAKAPAVNLPWEIERQRAQRKRLAEAEVQLADAQARGVRVFRDKAELPDEYREARFALRDRPWNERSDDAHEAECEHHALLLTPNGYVEAVCLQPDAHAAGGHNDDVAAAERERENREFADAVEVANKVRGDWVRSWIRSYKLSSGQVVAVMTAMARTSISAYLDSPPDDIAYWLELNLDPDADTEVALEAWLSRASSTPTAQRSAAKALVAVMAAHYEHPDTWTWQKEPDALLPWFDLLEQLGYQPSDWERERLDAAKEGGGDG